MCTCITYENGDFYFGRNMDLEYRFGEKVVITPRNYVLPLKVHPAQKLSYAMIGMAAVREEYPLYAEAVNENGLGMAGLNFPGNAAYREARKGSQNITPYELIPWVLGQCACRKEAVALLQELNLLNVPFAEGLPLTPLHWMIADRSGCSVLESTEEGVRIYENPYGVLTNNPPFPYDQHHMGNYRNLTAKTPDDNFAGALKLPLLGQGQGAAGLPGDFSPVSRFVRAVFLKWNSRSERDEMSNISQFFHVLDGVAMVRGSVITESGAPDMTTYSCCVNADRGVYYYRTYENHQIQAVGMNSENMEGEELTVFELAEEQRVNYQN